MRLLIAEDDEATCGLISAVFRRGNQQLEIVHTVQEALAALSHHTYDCIILDLALLDSKGVETYNRVHEASPCTPIVVYSGTCNDDDVRYLVHKGVAFLPKQFSKLSDLRDALERAILRAKRNSEIVQNLQCLVKELALDD